MLSPRRRFLRHGALGACAAAMPMAFAKAPLAGVTAVSVHGMRLGSFEVMY